MKNYIFGRDYLYNKYYTDNHMVHGKRNLIGYSEDLNSAAYTKTNTSITTNVINDPLGFLTADKLVESNTTAVHSLSVASFNIKSNEYYNCSFYIKPAERLSVAFAINGVTATFNLSTGVRTAFTGNTLDATIVSVVDGWYKINIRFYNTTGTVNPVINLANTASSISPAPSYLGDGTSGLYIWGMCLTLGYTPLEYIKTPPFNAGGYNNGAGIYFTPDGTKMFGLGSNNDYLYRYDLSIPWEITSCTTPFTYHSYIQVNPVIGGSTETSPISPWFSGDGTRFFMTGLLTNNIIEYSLSTPWDITTMTLGANHNDLVYAGNLFFNSDGTKFYTLTSGTSNIHQYDLSTPYDLTTKTFIAASSFTILHSYFFSSDGLYVFTYNGYTGDKLMQYELATAWEIGTTIFIGSLNLGKVVNSNNSLRGFLSGDGTRLYHTSTNLNINPTHVKQIDLALPYRFSYPIEKLDKHNTFIGGAALISTMNSTSKLATKFGISWTRIKNFEIVGDDIKCTITGGQYSLANNLWSTPGITFYDDPLGLVTTISFYPSAAGMLYCNMPNLVTITGHNAFNQFSGTYISFPYLTSINSHSIFINAINLLTVYIPRVTSISDSSFMNCTSLTTIDITDATLIGSNSFAYASSLTTINNNNVLKYVVEINAGAFRNNLALQLLKLPACTTISNLFLSGSNSMEFVYAPKLSSIGTQAFRFVTTLQTLFIPSCTTFGSSHSTSDLMFPTTPAGVLSGLTITCHSSLQTSNAGGINNNIQLAITAGATVNFVNWETETINWLSNILINNDEIPTNMEVSAMDIMIKSLKTDGIWSKLDNFYNFAYINSSVNKKLIDIKGNATQNPEIVGSLTVSDYGFKSDANRDNYLDLNIKHNSGVNFTQNNCSFGVIMYQSAVLSSALVGISTGNTISLSNVNSVNMRINSTTSAIGSFNMLTGLGLKCINRDNNTNIRYFSNNVEGIITQTPTVALLTNNLWLFRSGPVEGDAGISMFFRGASLTLTETQSLRTIYNTYLTSIGLSAL